MLRSPARDDRRGTFAAAVVSAALALAGGAAVVRGLQPAGGAPQPPVAAAEGTAAPAVPVTSPSGAPAATPSTGGTPLGRTLTRSRPVRLDIPSIGVHSDHLVDLGTQRDGSLEVPADYGTPGWFTGGSAPGQFGPAVIAGHVDNKKGPAVFFRLGALRPGATVRVSRKDGVIAVFTVDRVARFPKDHFPTQAVYGDVSHRAELRLITCGGDFDRRSGHYRDNVVAFAHLTSTA